MIVLSLFVAEKETRQEMPNAREQSGARRGWSKHEELQQQAWLRVL